jgi:hypothetical protein
MSTYKSKLNPKVKVENLPDDARIDKFFSMELVHWKEDGVDLGVEIMNNHEVDIYVKRRLYKILKASWSGTYHVPHSKVRVIIKK